MTGRSNSTSPVRHTAIAVLGFGALAVVTYSRCARFDSPNPGPASLVPDGGSDGETSLADAGTNEDGGSRHPSRNTAPPGTLDLSFGDGGVTFSLANAEAHSLLTQQDGGILVGGFAARAAPASGRVASAFASFTPDGRVDPSFGNDGVAVTPIAQSNKTLGAAGLPDGRYIAVGSALSGPIPGSTLIRYRSNGQIDPFGDGGTAIRLGAVLQAVALYANESIAAGGFTTGRANQALLTRYLSDGTLDSSYGNGGDAEQPVVVGSQDQITAVAIDRDEKVVAAGAVTGAVNDFLVRRYTTGGYLDRAFGNQGSAMGYAFPSYAFANAVAIQPDGKIVVAGYCLIDNFSFAVVRYQPDGTLDTAFGDGGAAITPIPGGNASANAVAIQPDGKILAGGYSMDPMSRFTIVRYQPDGNLDLSFGNNGLAVTSIGYADRIFALTLDSDFRILAAGYTYFTGTVLTVARYLP